MSGWRQTIIVASLSVLVFGAFGPGHLQAESGDCAEFAARFEDQNERLSGELRRVHREIAALRADLEKPGLPEVVGGIGYIFGLFGVAAYVASRRKGA